MHKPLVRLTPTDSTVRIIKKIHGALSGVAARDWHREAQVACRSLGVLGVLNTAPRFVHIVVGNDIIC